MESIHLKDLKNDENNILEENNQDSNDQKELDSSDSGKLTKLPIGRIRTIIKADTEINLVNQEAVFLITKATELFIGTLAKESYKYTHQSNKKTVQKHDIQNAIDNVNALIFLDGM